MNNFINNFIEQSIQQLIVHSKCDSKHEQLYKQLILLNNQLGIGKALLDIAARSPDQVFML